MELHGELSQNMTVVAAPDEESVRRPRFGAAHPRTLEIRFGAANDLFRVVVCRRWRPRVQAVQRHHGMKLWVLDEGGGETSRKQSSL